MSKELPPSPGSLALSWDLRVSLGKTAALSSSLTLFIKKTINKNCFLSPPSLISERSGPVILRDNSLGSHHTPSSQPPSPALPLPSPGAILS